MRQLLTVVAFVAALLVPGGPATADGDYPPQVSTSCNINVPHVAVGQRVHLVIEVASNTNEPVTGTVELTIATAARREVAAARRGVVWTRSVRYEGSPLEVLGPELPRGRYRVAMAFTPDDSAVSGCRNAVPFRVGAGGETGGEDDDDGVLPNTGGPHLWILMAGLGLVVAGGGLAGSGRRSRAALA